MKTALAIVCSLLLVWTNVIVAQVPGASGPRAARSCCHCGKLPCCATNHSMPESSPVSTAPASFQNHFSPLAPAALAWTLPIPSAGELSSPSSTLSRSADTALFTRDCALLI